MDISTMHAAFVRWAASKDGGNYKDGNYLPRSDFGWAAWQEGVRRGRAEKEPGKAVDNKAYEPCICQGRFNADCKWPGHFGHIEQPLYVPGNRLSAGQAEKKGE